MYTHKIKTALTFLLLSALFLGLPAALWAYLFFNPQFGGSVIAAYRQKYARSPQWDGEKFVNQQETSVDIDLLKVPELIRENIQYHQAHTPDAPLPVVPFDRQAWAQSKSGFQFIWYGHAACLMRLDGQNFLIDPMFGPDASPVGPVHTQRFSKNTLDILEELPELQAIFLTHDHYDHLDYQSILRLKGKTAHFYVALGVKRHLLRWGIAEGRITEFDWWEAGRLGNIDFTFTPSRHFSGRSINDRAKCMWGGWAFHTPNHRIYWSGDGGYGPHCKEVGERLGPFDWAFVECGQYYKLWTQVHQLPEEAVKAVKDARAKIGLPVHWGAFKLAPHHWKERAERFCRAAAEQEVEFAVPRLGAIYTTEDKLPQEHWWGKF